MDKQHIDDDYIPFEEAGMVPLDPADLLEDQINKEKVRYGDYTVTHKQSKELEEFEANKRKYEAEKFRAEAEKSSEDAKFIATAKTEQTLADARLSHTKSKLVEGAETQLKLAQAKKAEIETFSNKFALILAPIIFLLVLLLQ